ncbi:alpha/beta fold hydrolase [Solitalea lacus]|uniref:alpha/beta fold hydrolase n=1 Tax=Solitalea lacus TaxID=2911172 RepID=UPI001EDC8944|nr:alpha/beta hydrolase [Solitalea lacus]UKJ08872.1 alpha/beta hydrolase [Solitalea lacus]
MKKIKFLLILLGFVLLCINVFATEKSFNVEIAGDGKQTVILIPGFTCSGDVWNETIVHLKQKFKCYKLTMAGFAGSKAQENPALKNWEEDIAKFIDEQKLVKPIVIGHSMGGTLAMMLASDYPDKVGKIVVVDAIPCLPAMFNPTFKCTENPDCSQMITTYTQMDDAKFAQNQLAGIKRLVADTSKYNLITKWGIDTDRKTYGKLLCDLSNVDLRDRIASISCPSLILLEAPFKQFDSVMKVQFAKLNGSKIAYSDKALHFIMYDDKEWYLNQLANFLN